MPEAVDIVDLKTLCRLAEEPIVESRLVKHIGEDWHLFQGPFEEQTFSEISDPWSLLVQAVDFHLPEVQALWAKFQFLPTWLRDDIMISYSVNGGGVGPHFDHYDVFLIQVSGKRNWKIGQPCGENEALREGVELGVLEQFHLSAEYTTHPGDILYLPPRLAHWGTALSDDCITLSVGFRAPSMSEAIMGLSDYIAPELGEFTRLPIPSSPSSSLGQITSEQLHAAKASLRDALSDDAAFAAWFGQQMSTPKYPEDFETSDITDRKRGDAVLLRADSRIAYYRTDIELLFFANGYSLQLPLDLEAEVKSLCAMEVQQAIPSNTDSRLLNFLIEADALLSEPAD